MLTNNFTLLILSLVAISLGPALYQLYTFNRKAIDFVDRIVFLIVGGLVVFHLVPHSFEKIGWVFFPLLFLGASIPAIIEKGKDDLHKRVHKTTIVIICIGILMHSFLDGIALIIPCSHQHDADFGLSLAVILHRVPVGLTIWMLAKPIYGFYKTVTIITIMCIITLFGFFFHSLIS